MGKKIISLLLIVALFGSALGAGLVQAQEGDKQAAFKEMLNALDTSITSLRKGNIDEARDLVSQASANYDENFKSDVQDKDPGLNNKIVERFIEENKDTGTPDEENIFVLRVDVSSAAGLIGVSLSPVYAYSMFIILGVAAAAALLITLLTKRLVNWDRVRENKAKISEFLKELREAQSKRDMKRLHKLQQRQAEIRQLQGQVFTATLKPTIIYIIPLMLIWFLLTGVYSGWIVAWLPFNFSIPILAPEGLVAFGVGWWYFITYLGFSQIFRKILIRD